ncbi:MAG TPA: hypothetical protein VHK91_14015 [Flavisolibacter sp.]|jgi:hypothetical protein|nr:hypothetical protein [Flavisolibacter sp.]
MSFVVFTYCTACNKAASSETSLYDSIPETKVIIPLIREISGIAQSGLNSQTLYGIEDSGNPPVLYQIGKDGLLVRKVVVKGAANRDWEDLVIVQGKVYIGDIGDNSAAYSNYTIYRFDEPVPGIDSVDAVEAIRFTYPDGPHDAEAFLVEGDNIYIITKRDAHSRIYKLAGPFNGTTVNALYVGELPFNGVTSAALNTEGTELIIKTYTTLFYFHRNKNEPLEKTVANKSIQLPYTMEPQGEAVCFAGDGSGYYTISELGFGSNVKLYYYKRK